jgi:DNA-directed RNA polymerase specialized sigma24 family protein
MEIYWEYSGCDVEDERQIESCWERIQLELEANLESLPDPASELRIAIDHDDAAPEWQIHAALHLPGKTLAVEASARQIEQAMDDLLIGLAGAIDDLRDMPVTVTKRIEGLEAIVALLEHNHHRDRRDAFMSFLTPVVASLASYVDRELQLREIEGSLPSTELSTSDVLDEVLVQAWLQFDARSTELPLDVWILRLVDQAIERVCQDQTIESLDDELPVPSREPLFSQADYWQEQATYPETIEVHELLAGPREGDAWDDVELEVKQMNVERLLAGMPREQRQALLLFAVHGFSEAEVADFQSRPKAEVRRDIRAAKKNIGQQLADQ